MNVEVTIQRLGGPDADEGHPWPRRWGPQVIEFPEGPNALTRQYIHPEKNHPMDVVLSLRKVQPVDLEMVSFQLLLETMSGQPYGVRPGLLFARLYDVPTYTNLYCTWAGHFTIGLRVVA